MKRRLGWMARALLCAGLSACAPGYRLEAASGGTAERATASGFSFTASVNAWPGSSRQLVDQVLPVWIQIKNQSSTPVRVRYADFGAVDEHRFWFGMVDPKTGRIIELPAESPPAAPPQSVAPPAEQASSDAAPRDGAALPVMAFDTESAWDDEHSVRRDTRNDEALECERSGACARATLLPAWQDDPMSASLELVGHHPGIGGRGFGGPPRSSLGYGHTGYYGGFGGYYGYGYPYYGYAGYGYPGYYGYYAWGWPYYASGTYWPYAYYGYGRPPRGERLPTTAMMQHVALAEGELKPGASTAGFVYLPSAALRAAQLDVTWAVHSTQGQPLTEISARFVTVIDE